MRGIRAVFVILLLLIPAYGAPAVRAAPIVLLGSNDGAAYKIEMPAHWNGTLVLFSHGYVGSGAANPAMDAPDSGSASWLLAHGYALAGSSYGATGWAVADALRTQPALLDLFARRFGRPRRTIAWGQSLGGLVTAGLVQLDPSRFAAALPMCGVLAGGVAIWNQALDAAFAFKTLLAANSALEVVHIANPIANVAAAQLLLAAAQSTPQGQARLSLVAALVDGPGWFDPFSAPPSPTAYSAQLRNQVTWDERVVFPFMFAARAELEQRAGGNPSWNTTVDYRAQLAHSTDQAEVRALYRRAGLNLEADLLRLQAAPRISADLQAVAYLRRSIDLNGDLHMPVLTLHTTGDGLVSVQNEQDYARVVDAAGKQALLGQLYVRRAGHCAFTPAEEITAFQRLILRLDSGRWDLAPAALNHSAALLGSAYTILPPAFVSYTPAVFPRPDDR